MKKLAALVVAAVVALAFSTVGVTPGHATGTLDQQNTTQPTGLPVFALVHLNFTYAQTFTAGLTGSLDRVDLDLERYDINTAANLTVQITATDANGNPATDANGTPTGGALATATVPASSVPSTTSYNFVSVLFSTPAPSVAGTKYAIVLSTSDPSGYKWLFSGSDTYAGGTGVVVRNMLDEQGDFLFKTYVSSSAPVGCTSSGSGGNMTIPSSGTTCLSGATVNGNLTVPTGGSLVLLNSTVGGNLNANGAVSITICGSRIGGSLTVANSTGPVVVGDGGDDGSPACGGNTIGNNVTLNGNRANAELAGNRISGNVGFNNNTGSGGVETSPEVEANTISGNLACSGNSSVSNDGLPNTVGGNRTGQCGAPLF